MHFKAAINESYEFHEIRRELSCENNSVLSCLILIERKILFMAVISSLEVLHVALKLNQSQRSIRNVIIKSKTSRFQFQNIRYLRRQKVSQHIYYWIYFIIPYPGLNCLIFLCHQPSLYLSETFTNSFS